MQRRDFLLLSMLIGMNSTFFPSRAIANEIKALKLSVSDYQGPLLERIIHLLDKLDRREISGESYADELQKMYAGFDLESEFGQWYSEVPQDGSKHRLLLKHEEVDRYYSFDLYYVATNSSAPPHGHHRLISTQTVLKGELELRQYDRVKRVDSRHVLLRPKRSLSIDEGNVILMTEDRDNVHWFGTKDKPALIFNFQVRGIPGTMFDPDRSNAREYLDPTAAKDADGLILAAEMTRDEAFEKFSSHRVTEFEF